MMRHRGRRAVVPVMLYEHNLGELMASTRVKSPILQPSHLRIGDICRSKAEKSHVRSA